MELIYSLPTNLGIAANALKFLLESVSLLCVALGLVTSLVMALGNFFRTGRFICHLHSVRLHFGTWLGVALEFQLGADIVATTINPTLQSLGELALLAAIRTFLNYFLQKELEAGARLTTRPPEPVATIDKPGLEKPKPAQRKKDYPCMPKHQIRI
jgi:uncharacterized membrane protein